MLQSLSEPPIEALLLQAGPHSGVDDAMVQLLRKRAGAHGRSQEAEGIARIGEALTVRNGCNWGVIQAASSGLAGT